MSLRRRPRTAYTKSGGGLEERREGVGGGIAYFRFLPFFFHIYDSNSLILYPGFYSGINNSPEKHQISLNFFLVLSFILLCSKLIINITIPLHKTNLKGNIL